jgi:hypothetical protein
MHNSGQKIVVRHKEFLGEITSQSTFGVQRSFTLNPGLHATFPWLANIASSFQEYSIKGLVFHYIPTSGSAVSSVNAALGSVMLQTSYRSSDRPPSNKAEMLNEFWSSEGVPAEAFVHPIECDPKENPFNIQYVRTGRVPAGDSQLSYDLGVTHVAVSGCQSDGNALGDLWVTYEIELSKPIVSSNVTFRSAYTEVGNAFATPTNLFGSGASATGTFEVTYNANSVTLPKGLVGNFLFTLIVSATSPLSGYSQAGNPTLSGGLIQLSATTVSPFFNRVEQNGVSDAAGAGAFVYIVRVSKSYSELEGIVTFPTPVITTGAITGANLLITQVPTNA